MAFLKISSILLTALLNFFLSLLVLSNNPRKIVNRSFALICFFFGIWSLCLSLYEFPIVFDSFFWIKATYLVVCPLIVLFLFFTFVFPSIEKKFQKAAFFLCLAYIVFSLWLLFSTNLWVIGVFVNEHGVQTILGKGYLWWGIFDWLILAWAVFNLLKKSRKAVGSEKAQLRYVSFGFLLWGIFVNIPDFILPLLANNTQYFSISPLASLPFVGLSTYVIIRHRFMDLRIIVRSLVSEFLTITILSVISGAVVILYSVIFHYPIEKAIIFPIVSTMILVVIIFPYLAQRAETYTRNHLVKGGYDPKLLLKKLVATMSSTVGFETMLRELLMILAEGLNIKSAAFLLITSGEEKENNQYKIINAGEKRIDWPDTKSLINLSEIYQLPLVREELQEIITKKNDELTRAVVSQMTEKKIAAIFPLKTKKKLTGFLLLGDKPLVDSFTVNDLNMLETFASQAHFALENARLFSEIQTFNERLAAEVKRATEELRDQNRFLAALRRLDLIIMETLEIESLCQKIVNSLSLELKCQFGIIGLINENQNRFYFKAVTANSELDKLLVQKRVKLEEIFFPLDHEHNLLEKAINTRREVSGESLTQIFYPSITQTKAEKWQNELDTRTYWIYPILTKTRVLGILAFGWKKAEREITSRERDLMRSVIDQTGIALDNTLLYEQLKESVRKLKRANLKLRELDLMKDEFVSIASHELRTPMTSINNYIWMVLHGRGGKISPKQEFYLERASISTQRLINLVEDMLTVSRIEGGKLEFNPVSGNIYKLAKSAVEEMDLRARQKKVNLFLETPKKELPLVFFDPDRIREVLTNIIVNAIKFTDSGGQITVSFKKKGRMVSTIITDNGRGIAKTDIPKLFKKFGRIEHSFATVAETTGTGLGLYICKQIIDLHRGKIGAKSQIDKGSTFYFDLKIAK